VAARRVCRATTPLSASGLSAESRSMKASGLQRAAAAVSRDSREEDWRRGQEWGIGDRLGHSGIVGRGNDTVILRFGVRNELLRGGEDVLVEAI
jgi:hypothetical protein